MSDFECKLRITRDINADDLKAMMRLRKEAYYDDPEDPRYSRGGLQNLYSESWIAESHAKDKTSHFVLINESKSNALVAYSRFSFTEPGNAEWDERLRALVPAGSTTRAIWLQVTVITEHLRGKPVNINGRNGKISDISFDERIAFAKTQGCNIAFCDIVTSPVRNNPSLRYIARHGLQEIGEAERLVRDNKTVIFTRYAFAIG